MKRARHVCSRLGLFTLIYMLQSDKEPVTITRLAKDDGTSWCGQVGNQLKKLIDIEVIESARKF